MTVKSGDIKHYEATYFDKEKNKRIRRDIFSEHDYDYVMKNLEKNQESRGMSAILLYELNDTRYSYLRTSSITRISLMV